jgi:hypothetical protein
MKISASKSNAAIPTTIRAVFRRMATTTSRIRLFFGLTRRAVSCSSLYYSSDRVLSIVLADENWSSGEGIYPGRLCASNSLFDVLRACVGHGYPPEEDELATQQSATIIAAARKRVCALIDSFAVCLHRKLSGSGSPARGSCAEPYLRQREER